MAAKRRRKSTKSSRSKAKLGSGARFRSLTKKLSRKGVRNPKALAAAVGRKKYGSKRYAKLSAQGRKRAARKRKRYRSR